MSGVERRRQRFCEGKGGSERYVVSTIFVVDLELGNIQLPVIVTVQVNDVSNRSNFGPRSGMKLIDFRYTLRNSAISAPEKP